MRMATNSGHPDYHPKYHEYQPYLNGVKVKNVYFADEEAGILSVYKQGEDGKPFVEEGQVAVEDLHGTVEIRHVGPFRHCTTCLHEEQDNCNDANRVACKSSNLSAWKEYVDNRTKWARGEVDL